MEVREDQEKKQQKTHTILNNGKTPSLTPVIPPPTATTSTADNIIAPPSIKYKECLRNHGASIAAHVLDGCGEFMPSGEENTPEFLKCAACECHRNFHRKDIDHPGGEEQPSHHHNHHHHHQYPSHNNGSAHQIRIPSSSIPLRIQSFNYHHTPTMPPMMMTFGGGGWAESSSEDLNMFDGGRGAGGQTKKRFRTKFTGDQKDKMMEFAEKIGWKFQKQDEVEIQRFCKQLGVKRQVFKVWMHNNKNSVKKNPM